MRHKASSTASSVLVRGFTIIELSVVIIAISILVTLTFSSTNGYLEQARDSERVSDVEVIARALERNYRNEAIATGATYPATTVGTTNLATIIEEIDATIAPDQTANSLVIATSNASQAPTFSQYVYQPLNADGSLCTAAPCVRYRVYYRLEESNTVVTRDSLRQQ